MRKVALVCVLLALFGTACADGGDPSVVEGPPEETTEASSEPTEKPSGKTVTFTDTEFALEMKLDDFYFDPATIKAPGDSSTGIMLRNVGSTAHTFTIDALKMDRTVESGEKELITLKLGTETRYEYYCRFHGESQGMKGSFSLH
jgi:plastocyanin